jgi:uncharacterized membrane protein YqgA involved in biofilm formation
MYRYSQQMRGNTGAQRMRQQVSKVLSIVLVIAVVVLGIIGGNAMRFEGKEQTLFRERMQNEAGEAIAQVNNLSRTGGSNTANLLGKLRQHVYAMQTLQVIHVGLRGNSQQVLDASVFDTIYTVIDTFDARLQTGQQTKEPQTQLLTLLTDLKTKIDGIK